MIHVESVGGSVDFDGTTVTIRRTSRIAKSVFGNTETVIPIGRIGAVEWKPARWSGAGHIRFAVPGSQAAAEATPVNRDVNAVLFGRREQPAFEKLRDLVRDALSQ